MNVTVRIGNEKRHYFNARCLSVEEGREIFFIGKHENNSCEIPLSYGHVEIEIKIKDKKNGED
jgi:hypothetical protein|nr:MAG TPA: hypothetical protein [Caudoviricetes sp.]DAO67247.1 MAG TPA: hypothetical protein [Caudoviricetes sp.]